MWMRLDGDGSLTGQLVRALREAIRSGRLAGGDRAPSSRVLAAELGLSRVTVVRAFEQLLAEGYLEGRHGSGTYVREDATRTPAPAAAGREMPELRLSRLGTALAAGREPLFRGWLRAKPLPYDFRYGMPSLRDFPLAAWQRCLARTARSASIRAHDYGPPGGVPALRTALAARLARARGIACRPEQVLVVAGSQQALDLAARVLLDPGDAALVEEPGYEGARAAFAGAGARVVPAPVDGEGIDPASAAGIRRLRAIHVTPAHQYPLGSVLSARRRVALLALADRAGAVVLEDDYDGEYRYDGSPLETLFALDGGRRVVHVGTFSKLLFPALRLGYAVLPERLVEPMTRARLVADGGGASLEQLALARFLEDGDFERHVRRARLRNRERREALVSALREELGDDARVEGSNAGLHLVCWLPRLPARSLGAFVRAGAERGVGLYPISPYYQERPREAGLVMGYSGLAPEDLRAGVRRMAGVLASFLPPRPRERRRG